MSTEPERLTAAVPENPAATPTAAMSSLFVAVTATPRNPAIVVAPMSRGPKALASPDGSAPCLLRLCDRPVAALLLSGMSTGVAFVASSFVAARPT